MISAGIDFSTQELAIMSVLTLALITAIAFAFYFYTKLSSTRAIHEHELKSLTESKNQLELQRNDHLQNINELQQRLTEKQTQLAALQEKNLAGEEKLALLQEAKVELSKDFQILADKIFQEKSKSFNETSKQALDTAIVPLREQLSEFKRKVEHVYDTENKERATLKAELQQLKNLNIQMSEDAVNLTKALKGDNKVQGNWGEVVLERILEESGLRKGHEYETQVSLQSYDGRKRNPDVIVRLPENKDIVIDSKVSLVDYEQYCKVEDEDTRKQSLKKHVLSLRAHINGLSLKEYEALQGVRSLDFVFIFIPIEAAFMAAFENDPSLFRDAYDKNIIVVSPTTLLATLRTVQSIWRYERQNKNAEEIARQAGALHDKFVGFVEDLNKVEDYLFRAGEAHANAVKKLSTGKGNLVTSTQRLQKLGAKAKKSIPQNVVDDEAQDTDIKQLEIESDPQS